ncbi:MAG: hypothetical protein ACLPJH_20180 [Myxococcaceae bacterium]
MVADKGMRPAATTTALRSAIVAGALGAAAGATLLTTAIARSTLSTATFGFLELPVVLTQWAAPSAAMGFCAGYWVAARRMGGPRPDVRQLLAALGLLAIGVPSASYVFSNLATSWEVGRVANMGEEELEHLLASKRFGTNPFVLAQVAQNPRASPALLRDIALRQDPRLHQKLWNIFDTLGSNRRGLAVMRLVARHPNVDGETLDILAQSEDGYVLSDVASNPKLSPESRRHLEERSDAVLQWALAGNRKTAPGTLDRLSRSPADSVRQAVAANPSAAPDVLARLGEDAQADVRRNVAANPSASPETRRALAQDSDGRVKAALLRGVSEGPPVLRRAPPDGGNAGVVWFEWPAP